MASYTGTGFGRHSVFASITGMGFGRHSVVASITGRSAALHRVANAALAVYELYRGVDESPDLDAAPWETFATLPHDTAALDVSHAYHFVLRLRNQYGLVSQNIRETLLTIDAGGLLVATSPSVAANVTIAAEAGSKVRVRADYPYEADGGNQATRFLIYLTDDGDDPVVGVDVPTVVTMTKADGVAKLSWLSAAFAPAATIKVLIRTRRIDAGPVNVDSASSSIVSAVTSSTGPAAPAGNIAIGNFAQVQ